ncbi:MAG TPA: helix-turn-helix transcriptional regulator [Candidatus Avimuribaculum pullicola]|nr:helix-turn-helix transcriptional regulator [Candidatus Avimuribaculum pullicola]
MKSINQTVGENLKKIREISGFTQEQVAKSIGIERSAYSNYETGTREVPYEVIEKISNLFGCEPFIFFEDDIQVENEIMATAFRISDLEDNDLKEIANFKDIVKSYLKMERIANG